MKLKELIASTKPKMRADLIWFLSYILQLSKSEIFLHPDRLVDAKELKKINAAMTRRKKGEPLQYIMASAPFFGRDFFVNTGVLIPRPETEMLVDMALKLFPATQEPITVLDLCTGSGVVGITIKLERADWQVTATDISSRALSIAKKNAKKLGANISLHKADLYSAKLQKTPFSLVVANPPYLDFKKDKIMEDVKYWEPKIALQPFTTQKVAGLKERAAWLGEKILLACSLTRPQFTLLELSPRIAILLEKRWKNNSAVNNISREADLAGRKRFLLVAWNHG